MAASAEHPAVTPDSNAQPGNRPVTEPARAARDSDPELIEQRVQAALAASTRTEASLSTLFRAVREMTDGLSGAREANEQMVGELGTVRRMLRQATERNTELEAQLATLRTDHEAALGLVAHLRAEAERERAFLVEEQDRFLAALLEEHDEAVTRLEARLEQAKGASSHDEPPPQRVTAPAGRLVSPDSDTAALARDLAEARRNIDRLVRERDRSREVLRRLQAQRDEAQRALDTAGRRQDAIRTVPHLAAEDPPKDTAAANRKTDPLGPMARAAAAAAGRAPLDDASIFDRATTVPPTPVTHPTPPPELRAAITAPPAPTPDDLPSAPSEARSAITAPSLAQTSRATKPPPLKQKPDPASRPIGGYSLKPERGTETVEGSRISSKPPRS